MFSNLKRKSQLFLGLLIGVYGICVMPSIASAAPTHNFAALLYVSENYKLTPAQKASLAADATSIASSTPTSVTLTGYTDRSGGVVANQALSWRRAIAALEQLRRDVRALGDTTTKFVAVGSGATTKFGPLSQNRRVDIVSTGGTTTATLTGSVGWSGGSWPDPPFTSGANGSSLFTVEVQVNGHWYANATLSTIQVSMETYFTFSIPNVPLTNGGATIALIENDGPTPLGIASMYCLGLGAAQSATLTPTPWTNTPISGVGIPYLGDSSLTVPGVTVSAANTPVNIYIGVSNSSCG